MSAVDDDCREEVAELKQTVDTLMKVLNAIPGVSIHWKQGKHAWSKPYLEWSVETCPLEGVDAA